MNENILLNELARLFVEADKRVNDCEPCEVARYEGKRDAFYNAMQVTVQVFRMDGHAISLAIKSKIKYQNIKIYRPSSK